MRVKGQCTLGEGIHRGGMGLYYIVHTKRVYVYPNPAQGLVEWRRDAYENSRIYKENVKAFNDKNIIRKTFEPNQKVLLYNSSLHLFPG